MTTLLIRIQSQPSTDQRCPYCHGELGAERVACPQCQTEHHSECLAELGRCTVMGCTHQIRKVRRVRPGATPHRPGGLWRWIRGASLAGMVLCVGFALVVDSLRSGPRGGNDAAAIGALKAISNAQVLYREGDKDGDGTLAYSPTLEGLTNTGPRRDEDLIDEVLGAGSKQGYVFAITSSSEFVWTANANPAVPGTTGDRYFGANHAGLIYFHTERPVIFEADGSSNDPVLGR